MSNDANIPEPHPEQPAEQAKPEVDPLDPARFRVDPAGANPAGAKKVLVRIPVGKPGRDAGEVEREFEGVAGLEGSDID